MVVWANLAVALMLAWAAAADHVVDWVRAAASGHGQEDITRGWQWWNGEAIMTLTARGPTDQVNQLDPQDPTRDCQECELTSSIQFVPGHEKEVAK
jgi:hypothetical protein